MSGISGRATSSCQNGQIASKASRQNPEAGAAMLLSFPATRNILWDKRPIGTPIILHSNHYRNPTLIIEEKTLRLAHRFTQDSNCDTYSCVFIASLSTDSEREGICINIDRFEANSELSNEEVSDKGMFIPCLVKKNSAKPKTSVEDYAKSLKVICDRCRSKKKIVLEEFISLYAYCSYHENQQNFLFHMDFTMVTSGARFKLTPINSIPVVPTALSKNLAGPLSVSHLHGEPKSGYLTMDQTRKILLVLESDPKAPALPLVGIWVSGVPHVRDPFVWASCLRYIFNPDLKERIVCPPEAFVVIVYTPIHSKPEFYECVTINGQVLMQFDLNAGHEVIQLPKNCLGRAQSPLEMELLAVESGEKKDLFEAATENNRSLLFDKGSSQNVERMGNSDDIMPRSTPTPHYGKEASMIKPSVPEVSLLLDENESNFFPRPVPVPTRMTKAPVYPHQAVSKSKNKKSTKGQRLSMQSLSEPVSPLINNYNNLGAPQKTSSVPASPATPQYRAVTMTYTPPGPQQTYPQPQGQFDNPYNRGFSPYSMGGYPGPPTSSAGPQQVYSHPQHQVTYPPYQYNGFPNMPGAAMPTSPQMQMYPPPNAYQGPSSLPWNVNMMYNMNQLPNLPGNAPNTVNPNKAQQPEQFPQGVHNGSTGNMVPGLQQTDNMVLNTGGEKGQVAKSSHKGQSSVTHPGQKRPFLPGGDDEATLLKQGDLSPGHHSLPSGSAGSSPHQQSGSTDSGLHVSDTADPDALVNNTMESLQSSLSNPQVPADVYELLKMQDMQLKMLREQLSQLLSKQGKEPDIDVLGTVPPPSLESRASHDMATQSSLSATLVRKAIPAPLPPEKCTTAVNTSLWYTEPEQARHDLTARQGHSFNLTTQDISIQAGHLECETTALEMPVTLKSPQLRLKDRQMYEHEGNMTTDTISLGELQLTSIQDRTEESIMSEMVVDMPAYNSVSPEKHSSSGCTDDESNRSPQLGESVSMYERQNFADTEESVEVAGRGDGGNLLFDNQKQFYQNLMGGVQKFLAKSVDCSNDTDLQHTPDNRTPQDGPTPHSVKYSTTLHRSRSEPCDIKQAMERSGHNEDKEPVNVEEITREQLRNLGISMEQISGDSPEMSSYFLDPVMLPKCSYVSLMLDSESECGTEADALAMKYLTDEQLTELAKVRMNASINRKHRDLDGLVTASPRGKGNITFMGSNHMSFASKKYLERYGLNVDGQDKSAVQDSMSGTFDKTPVKEPMFNVRQVLQKLSEQSFMGDLSVPKMSDTSDQLAMGNGTSGHEGDTVDYNSDSFTALSGKPMSTPAEHKVKPADFDAYVVKTPVRLRPPQQRGYESGSSIPRNSQQNNYIAPHYNHRNEGGTFDRQTVPEANQNQPPQGWQRKSLEGGIEGLNMPGTANSKASDKVLDIERLRELPKLL